MYKSDSCHKLTHTHCGTGTLDVSFDGKKDRGFLFNAYGTEDVLPIYTATYSLETAGWKRCRTLSTVLTNPAPSVDLWGPENNAGACFSRLTGTKLIRATKDSFALFGSAAYMISQ